MRGLLCWHTLAFSVCRRHALAFSVCRGIRGLGRRFGRGLVCRGSRRGLVCRLSRGLCVVSDANNDNETTAGKLVALGFSDIHTHHGWARVSVLVCVEAERMIMRSMTEKKLSTFFDIKAPLTMRGLMSRLCEGLRRKQ